MQIPGYRIIRKINQGGMSTVYLAIQLSVGREVALKVMSPALNADPVFSERFQREANIVGQLSHPNIVSIYDIGRYKNLNYIAMDYLPGGSIHDKMTTGLSTQEALRITKEIALALDHAHDKGYIHRDIKPENILFRENDAAVLSDFGVAKTVSTASRMTNAGTVVGTPHYMSPEQTRGKPVDGRADIYSLGVVFYEMLTGSIPYKAEEAVAIAIKHLTAPIPKLPAQHAIYQSLLNKLLAKDPDDRFQRGRELVDAIERLENTLNGRHHHNLNQTEPTAVQIYSLFKALLITSYAALFSVARDAVRYLFSWRWQPKHGFYRKRRLSQITEIRTEANTFEQNQHTMISTRVHEATAAQTVASKKRALTTRLLMGTLVTLLIWLGVSVGLQKLNNDSRQALPKPLLFWADLSANSLKAWASPWINKASTDDIINLPEKAVSTKALPQPIRPTPLSPASGNLAEEPVLSDIPALPNTLAGRLDATPGSVEPPRYELQVNTNPENARVRIMNIVERYYPGISLLPGRYHVQVTHKGYDSYSEWIDIQDNNIELTINLKKTPMPGATFHNVVASGEKGPEMVIVPAGHFMMGSKEASNATPVRRVRISHPFAVSKYEITFADYRQYAQANNLPMPDDNGWGQGSRPVVNISWQQAQAYTEWLSQSTGKRYRLPTEAEWEYVARANSKNTWWWGNNSEAAKGKANCRRGCDSDYAGFFVSKSAPVGTYPANAFGVFDTAGNVAEWTVDCYLPHYLKAPKDGSATSHSSCTQHPVRGGSMKSDTKAISNYYREAISSDTQANNIGFRVVVELY